MSFQEDAQKYGPVTGKILECWVELCEMGDRTSPAEYPDHCLITYDELADYMRQMRDECIAEALKHNTAVEVVNALTELT